MININKYQGLVFYFVLTAGQTAALDFISFNVVLLHAVFVVQPLKHFKDKYKNTN